MYDYKIIGTAFKLPLLQLQNNSGIIYKTQRAEVILEFKERPWLPNPLSLLYFIMKGAEKLMDKCVCKKKLYRSQIKKGTLLFSML